MFLMRISRDILNKRHKICYEAVPKIIMVKMVLKLLRAMANIGKVEYLNLNNHQMAQSSNLWLMMHTWTRKITLRNELLRPSHAIALFNFLRHRVAFILLAPLMTLSKLHATHVLARLGPSHKLKLTKKRKLRSSQLHLI